MYRNSHLSKLFLLGTLFLSMALALPLMAAQGATPPEPLAAESEPNDTIATADPIAIGITTAAIAPISDVDYFSLSLTAGQRVYLATTPECYDAELETALAVYDQNGLLLAENTGWPGNNVILRFIAPTAGNYFVGVISDGYYEEEEKTGDYVLDVRNVPADEPDDPFAAVYIPFGSDIDSAFFAPWDMDWYQFHARSGEVVQAGLTMDTLLSHEADLYILDVNDTYPFRGGDQLYAPGTANLHYVVPFETDFRVIASAVFFTNCEAPAIGSQPYHLTIERNSLYVAGSKAGNAGGVAFGVNDVLARNAAGVWRIAFDGEDVGLTKPLGGIEFMDDGSLLLSLSVAQSLPGLGMVKPADIVRFVPTQLGATTQGAFSFYLRGANTGLTTQGERIDAIALNGDGSLLISTYGSGSVPQFGGGAINVRDEDLLLFHPNGPMPAAGAWELWLNGNAQYPLGSGFSANDMRAATIVADGIEDAYYDISILFAADRSFRYTAWGDNGDQPFTAAPGDLVNLFYESHEPAMSSFWPYISRTNTLNFPRIISSVAIGPGWNQ